MANTTFRTCPDTGLKFYNSTEALLKANAVAAVVFLLVGGFHFLLVVTNWWSSPSKDLWNVSR